METEKEIKFSVSSYNKPLPKRFLKAVIALRASLGGAAIGTYFSNQPDVAFWILITGAILDTIIAFFSEEDKPKDNGDI